MVKILICPACKSEKINLYLGGYAGMLYQCASCGYVGPVVLVVDDPDALKELEELSKEAANGSTEERAEEHEKAPVKKTRRGGFK
ncbi:MAG: hypothetical protein B9J98_02980 [Candidatus Terraquivivens tikiterensis]|uniref:Uncharacterized protein n=1 Tax=Candidatus Terraquivivens tikiterensis TaxID=1980982 RepID=A0A2R7Y6N5_9ARCH|nr:MAG: hypothetical protein B9J98_02980 [Candidatus Terraquivivens tikiterensis]